MKQVYRLELEEARVMVRAAIAKSEEIGVLNPSASWTTAAIPSLERMDGAHHRAPDRLEQGLTAAGAQALHASVQHPA